MDKKKFIALCISLIFISMLPEMNAQRRISKIGSFDTFSDIGSPAIPGQVSYNESSQCYNISASGSNIWFNHDSFSFLWKEMKGDFIVQTQIKFIGKGHDLHRKTGIMFRESKDADAPMVACTIHGDGLTSLQYRTAKGENIQEISLKISGPDVLQLEKKGNSFSMSVAHFGEKYQIETIENLDIGDELMAGLFLCSHNDSYTEAVEFRNTSVFYPAHESLVQYEEFLDSQLEVLDIEAGHRQVLYTTSGSIQAPNWTPDGRTLIYNSSGLLYNFDIETRESSVLNTGFANKNNNDHVLTFDGTQLGISHHAEEANGESVIYTVPVEGGLPSKVTDKAPSYLHGWSPDNNFLVYTAERNGDYDIYRISKDGGKEYRLTKTQGLDDGPEYSPDGKYIYFNSSRTGTMQIWRMDVDGKNQIQLTFDELNDWFPHVSPDNKWLVFISFPEEVEADKHPFYKRVYLRLMPISGGESKVIAYLYGGQGSINVPSWSPDSKKIAFVSNGNLNPRKQDKTVDFIPSLNAYSFNDLLLSKEDQDQSFTLFNLLDWCAEQNIMALDPTGYYFPPYPEVPSDAYIEKFKAKAAELGIAISGTGIRNNFASPDPAVRAEGVELAKEWIVVASKLGAPVIRIFAGKTPKGYENNWEEPAQWMIDCFKELIPYAKKYGVKIGIQNHGDMLKTAEECLFIMEALNSEWVGIIVDTGNFHTKNPYKDIAIVAPYAVNWQIKERIFGIEGEIEIDYQKIVKILKESGYKGYIPIETLKARGIPYDPIILVPQMLKKLNTAISEEYDY